ncbi:MAG: hypothetical protein SOI38_05005 [Eggerthellaceae bacterium]
MPNENAEGAQGKAEDAQELSEEQESAEAGAEPDGAGAEDAQDAGSGNGPDEEPSDKHGQPGINREKLNSGRFSVRRSTMKLLDMVSALERHRLPHRSRPAPTNENSDREFSN